MPRLKFLTPMIVLSMYVVGCESNISTKPPIDESDDIIIQDLDGDGNQDRAGGIVGTAYASVRY